MILFVNFKNMGAEVNQSRVPEKNPDFLKKDEENMCPVKPRDPTIQAILEQSKKDPPPGADPAGAEAFLQQAGIPKPEAEKANEALTTAQEKAQQSGQELSWGDFWAELFKILKDIFNIQGFSLNSSSSEDDDSFSDTTKKRATAYEGKYGKQVSDYYADSLAFFEKTKETQSSKAVKDVMGDYLIKGTSVKVADILAPLASRESQTVDQLCGLTGENSAGIFQFYGGGELPGFLKNLRDHNSEIWGEMQSQNANFINELEQILAQPKIDNLSFNEIFSKYRDPLQTLLRMAAKEQILYKLSLVETFVDNVKDITKDNLVLQEQILTTSGLTFLVDNINHLGLPKVQRLLITTCDELKETSPLSTTIFMEKFHANFFKYNEGKFGETTWFRLRADRNRQIIAGAKKEEEKTKIS